MSFKFLQSRICGLRSFLRTQNQTHQVRSFFICQAQQWQSAESMDLDPCARCGDGWWQGACLEELSTHNHKDEFDCSQSHLHHFTAIT